MTLRSKHASRGRWTTSHDARVRKLRTIVRDLIVSTWTYLPVHSAMLTRLRSTIHAYVAASRKRQAAHDFLVAATLLELNEAITAGATDPQRIAE